MAKRKSRKVRVGTKIIPKMGSYKGKTLVVTQVARVKQGSKSLGTRTGQTVYFARQQGRRLADVFYTSGQFSRKKR
jgi:hypothetical protein